MASSPSRVGCDSCTWIAYIQQETIRDQNRQAVVEDRGAMCRHVLEAAEQGVIEIVVSALCLIEVLARDRTSGIDDQKVREFFDNDYILLVNLDKQVGDLARGLMLARHAGIKPSDAVHLATACVANVEEVPPIRPPATCARSANRQGGWHAADHKDTHRAGTTRAVARRDRTRPREKMIAPGGSFLSLRVRGSNLAEVTPPRSSS